MGFWEDISSRQQEVFSHGLLGEEPVAPAAVAAAADGPLRKRGRPKKRPSAAHPKPKRPSTPPPQLTAQERQNHDARVKLRKEELANLLRKKNLTEGESRRKKAILVEDEADRSNCCGEWQWRSFTGNEDHINTDVTWQPPERQLSGAALRARSELDLLRLFLTESVLDNLVRQTNLYAQQEGAMEGGGNQRFTPVTREEILAFIGVAIGMALVLKSDVQDYWARDRIASTLWFGEAMSGKRFRGIQRYLHVADNTLITRTPEGNLCDKLYKVRPLLDSLLTSFPMHFSPDRELSIDEQMIGLKARISFIQCMKDKPTKRGVKVWALCDSKVRYCLRFQIYTGGTGERGLSFRVVNELMTEYLEKGHHLYVDNFYTSPELLAHLLSYKTLAVGTVRQDRVHMPARLRTAVETVEVGQSLFLTSHDMTACRWKDKRDVFCLSTVHGNGMEVITRTKSGGHGEQEQVQKPKAICDYNINMGGVDVYDQLLSYHPIARRYKRWWLKVFWRLVDMMVVNAFALWKLKNPELVTKQSHYLFREVLAMKLTAPYRERNIPRPRNAVAVHTRLSHMCNPVKYKTRGTCIVCRNRNSKTGYGCGLCGDVLRMHISRDGVQLACMHLYHSKVEFREAYAQLNLPQ